MKKLMVIIAAIAMVGAFTATSIAAEWNFYGSSRMTTFSYDKSKEIAGNFDDSDTTWNSQTNSRFGAKVKASDAVSGHFEFQMGQDTKLRIMQGTWNFGAGELMVGQDYTPCDTLISSSVAERADLVLAAGTKPVGDGDASALTVGSFYESRIPMIQLKFGGLKLAFLKPAETDATDIDTTLPKIEASYTFKTDAFSVRPYGGYNTVDVTNAATDYSISVDSYVVGVTAGANFGPMYVKGNVFMGQNTGNYGRLQAVSFASADTSGTDAVDADVWGGLILAGFKATDMLTFEAGYAMDHGEIDVAGVTSENDVSHWYVNATVTLAPGVYIVPEVGMMDFGDLERSGSPTLDNGDCTYFGAKWQINF